MRVLTLLIWMSMSGAAWADGVPHAYIQEAEDRYVKGDFEGAIHYLLAVPGVAQLMPKLTAMDTGIRARLFYDLGCCYLAVGDSVRADQAFKEAFILNDQLTQGYFVQSDPGTFWWALLRNKEATRRLKTRRIFAAMRSIAIPGWGQFYRGHKKKGYAFLGAAIVTSGILGLQYRNFKNARHHYEALGSVGAGGGFGLFEVYKNQYYPNGDGTRYTEWESRHRRAKMGAKRVHIMLGIMGAIWALNLADSATFGPAPLGLSVQF